MVHSLYTERYGMHSLWDYFTIDLQMTDFILKPLQRMQDRLEQVIPSADRLDRNKRQSYIWISNQHYPL
jgi:hypothetical protein